MSIFIKCWISTKIVFNGKALTQNWKLTLTCNKSNKCFIIISTIILMLISKLGSPQNPKNLELVTFDKNKLNLKFKFSTDAVLTLILIGMVLLLWVIFSPLGIAN